MIIGFDEIGLRSFRIRIQCDGKSSNGEKFAITDFPDPFVYELNRGGREQRLCSSRFTSTLGENARSPALPEIESL